MSDIPYRPRPVVSTKSRVKIGRALGRTPTEHASAWRSIVRRNGGWAARWRIGSKLYYSQSFADEADAKKALAGLKARSREVNYREL